MDNQGAWKVLYGIGVKNSNNTGWWAINPNVEICNNPCRCCWNRVNLSGTGHRVAESCQYRAGKSISNNTKGFTWEAGHVSEQDTFFQQVLPDNYPHRLTYARHTCSGLRSASTHLTCILFASECVFHTNEVSTSITQQCGSRESSYCCWMTAYLRKDCVMGRYA